MNLIFHPSSFVGSARSDVPARRAAPAKPAEPGRGLHIAVSSAYAVLAAAATLLTLVAARLLEGVPDVTWLGVAVLLTASAVALRLPLHSRLRSLSRARALKLAASLHALAFLAMAGGTRDLEPGMVVVFGILPACTLFLASFCAGRPTRA